MQSTRLDLLAYAAARSVNALQSVHYKRRKQRAHAERLAPAVAFDMRQWFEATADSYFDRVSKSGIELAITEAKGADFAEAVSSMKKSGRRWLCLVTDCKNRVVARPAPDRTDRRAACSLR